MTFPSRTLSDGSLVEIFPLTFGRARLAINRDPINRPFTIDNAW